MGKDKPALLSCRMCKTSATGFTVSNLTQAIDIFSDWVDTLKQTQRQSQVAARSTAKKSE